MKVPRHHLHNTQYHSPKNAPDRSQEKKSACVQAKYNSITYSKTIFSAISTTKKVVFEMK